MKSHLITRARVAAPVFVAKLVALLVMISIAVDACGATLNFSIGAKEVIYTSSKRKSKGLGSWPDGNLGVVATGNGTYEFYGANGTKPVRTTGTLTDPGNSKKSVKIYNVPSKTFNYVSGGPIYQDPASGTRLMVYHAEKHGSSSKDYYSVLGLAVATDSTGLTFWDMGTIIEPNIPLGQNPFSIDIGGGSFAVFDNHLNVYYRDYLADGSSAELAVARASLTDLLANAPSGRYTPFNKYYNGSWTEPGRGGKASPLEIGNPTNMWTSVSYNDYLDQVVMVSSQWTATQPDLYLAASADGVNFSPRQPLVLDTGEQFYPTIVGTGADPTHSGQSFFVYYTDSKKGAWNRWSDAQLVRREVTFDPYVPPVDPLPPPPTPTPTDWALISDYQDDFQSGGPAQGWLYGWTSNGKLGNSANFSPLYWSDVAQVYNTTGAATTVPTGSKSHKDDYLHLSASGGHPGKSKYMPIAGYTIQAEDGAGLYRLAQTSIQKADGTTSSKEDGLGVLVYLNNTLLGSAISVSTNGLLANFDRELGQLNVGDTIWVMVDPLKTLYYDSFINFDFSIQKSVPLTTMGSGSLMALSAVPEPGSAGLLLMACLAGGFIRRRRRQ